SAQVQTGIRAGDVLVGRVVLGGEPVSEADLTLHRITPEQSGAWATSRSAADGSFGFPLVPDSSASFTVFLVTADYLGVRYFGPPVHVADPLPTRYEVVVHDTAFSIPEPVRAPVRNLVLAPGADGSWEVN